MSFTVRFSESARDDLVRLYDFLLDRAETIEDFDAAGDAIASLTTILLGQLGRSPFMFRKVGVSPLLRELLIPFKGSGYVALFQIDDGSTVTVLAVRHQREDDYH